MTFEDYWEEIGKLKVLPGMAIKQIPSSLSTETKKRLMKKEPIETVEILKRAIEQINHGSVENIESLVRKQL